MFMMWLMDQSDRDDDAGVVSRFIFKDYNNGCLGSLTSTLTVLEHFKERHPKLFFETRELMIKAMDIYVQRK